MGAPEGPYSQVNASKGCTTGGRVKLDRASPITVVQAVRRLPRVELMQPFQASTEELVLFTILIPEMV